MSAACLIKKRVKVHVLQGSSALTRAGMLLELELTRVLQEPAATQHVTITGLKQVQTELFYGNASASACRQTACDLLLSHNAFYQTG